MRFFIESENFHGPVKDSFVLSNFENFEGPFTWITENEKVIEELKGKFKFKSLKSGKNHFITDEKKEFILICVPNVELYRILYSFNRLPFYIFKKLFENKKFPQTKSELFKRWNIKTEKDFWNIKTEKDFLEYFKDTKIFISNKSKDWELKKFFCENN